MPEPLAVGDYPGVHVEFFEKPYRLYTVNGEKAVSVTTALGILDKPLEAWVERTTLAGVWNLLHRNYTLPDNDTPETCPWHSRRYVPGFAKRCEVPASHCVGRDPALCQLRVDLKNKRLDFYAQKKGAAERGTDVHQIWQDWNEKQQIPNAAAWPKDRAPRIRALAKFIMEHRPECLESEKVVGSAAHGFAGRLDTVVVLRTADGDCMVDIKNSNAIYPNSHFPQLIGYEIARRECGLKPTDKQAILRLDADGTYELGWSNAQPEDFLAILSAYKSQQKWARR